MTVTPPPAKPSLLRRLAAMFYDTFLVIALVSVVNAFALGVVVWSTGDRQEVLAPWLVQILTTLSIVGFFTVFWLKNGQTLGMQAWRIKLVDFNGNPPTAGKAILRCLGAALSFGCLGLGYLWCLIDRNQRCWHDYISQTELVVLPKTAKSSEP